MFALTRRASAATLISIAAISGVGLAAAPANAATTVKVLGTSNVRPGPTDATSSVRTLAAGTNVSIECKVTGKTLTNSNGYSSSVWNRTTSGEYIWDGTLNTDGLAISNCTGGTAAISKAIVKYAGKDVNTDFYQDGTPYPVNNPYQCWDLANRFALDNGLGMLRTGDGTAAGIYENYWSNGNSTNYTRIANASNILPKPGDHLVWDRSLGGGAGHVAVVVRADWNTVTVLEQNAPAGSATRVHTYSWDAIDTDIQGWLHAKKW